MLCSSKSFPRLAATWCSRRFLKTTCGVLGAGSVAYTADRYPIKRKDFSELNDRDVENFTKILDPHRIVTGQAEMQGKKNYSLIIMILCHEIVTDSCCH